MTAAAGGARIMTVDAARGVQTRSAQAFIDHEAAGDRELAQRAGHQLLLRRMNVAPRGELQVGQRAAMLGFERREHAGERDRAMGAGVERQQQELEMSGVAVGRCRSQAGHRRQDIFGNRGDDVGNVTAMSPGEQRREARILYVVAEQCADPRAGDAERVGGRIVIGQHEDVAEQLAQRGRIDVAAFGRARLASLALPIGEELTADRMFHTLARPRLPRSRDTSVPLSRTRIPLNGCAGHPVQRPCRGCHRAGLCRVKVKLTIGLPEAAALLMSARSLAVLSRFRRGSRTKASNRTVCAGRGGEYPDPREKTIGQGGCSQHPPFILSDCALAPVRQSRLSQRRLVSCRQVVDPLDFPSEPQPELPPEPPEAPREPILTLPAALTAYIVLLAVIHLRVLLPPDAENWTVDAFGFIPLRYDATPLNVAIPGGAGAKVWTFVTY